MKHFHVYSYKTFDKRKKAITRLVIFCPYLEIKKYIKNFKQQLRNHFLENIPPDEICVIGGTYHQEELVEVFDTKSAENFDIVPHFKKTNFKDEIFLFAFDIAGGITCLKNEKNLYFEISETMNRGMVEIFKNRGGLIVAHDAHHFVFPSGKHCDRFLRTGNVLVHGPEIYFLASQVIKAFSRKKYDTIYSDTSSINSLVFAVCDLMKRFDSNFITPHIESFGSYKRFEKEKFSNVRSSFFLISSSTSGSILERMIKHSNESIPLEQIAIMYGLSVKEEFKQQVISDLTLHKKTNPNGIIPFNTANVFRGDKCKLCEDGSAEVSVRGDVFLLEKPTVNEVTVTISDQPKYLKNFIREFKSNECREPSAIRCHYKECSSDKNYEVFIDIEHILDSWNNGTPTRYTKYFKKFTSYVQKHIPASTKYLIHLPDISSKKMAELMQELLAQYKIKIPDEHIVSMDDIERIQEQEEDGTIIIVSGCIVTGKNLLYLSRALRKTEDTMSRIFFTGIKRTSDKSHQDFLKKNLGMGEYGPGTHQIINVEEIYCEPMSKVTPWHKELEFTKILQDFLEGKDPKKYEEVITIFYERQREIENSGTCKGLAHNLFFNHPVTNQPLKIRKGFAFADNNDFQDHASQSDVYFIISNILNNLRYSENMKKRLKQTEYVRNIISPENFTRFNDGILQASFLRAARPKELLYDLTESHSTTMQLILGDMIRNLNDEHAEGLTEFLYAIAIKKMRLIPRVVHDCIELFRSEISKKKLSAPILEALVDYIEAEIHPKLSVTERFESLKNKNGKN